MTSNLISSNTVQHYQARASTVSTGDIDCFVTAGELPGIVGKTNMLNGGINRRMMLFTILSSTYYGVFDTETSATRRTVDVTTCPPNHTWVSFSQCCPPFDTEKHGKRLLARTDSAVCPCCSRQAFLSAFFYASYSNGVIFKLLDLSVEDKNIRTRNTCELGEHEEEGLARQGYRSVVCMPYIG